MSFSSQRLLDDGNSTVRLAHIVRENSCGRPVGIYSVCSANRFVLEAAIEQARADSSILCIESTSNQVNQWGGYTGLKPADFAAFVKAIALEFDFPAERILLGGDHLGPYVWRKEKAASAMEKASELVRCCVLAGYTKIHLDASMHCQDDPGDRGRPLADEIVSARAAVLCAAAERAHENLPAGAPRPLYIVGTEVPIPGGEQVEAMAPPVTATRSLAETLRLTEAAFRAQGLDAAWERVIAVVVQPGVEFGDTSVFEYDPVQAAELARFASTEWNRVYEAHSTDYQSAEALTAMVRDHFAILKVGPGLTFAFREAVFALARVEEELLHGRSGVSLSGIVETLEREMISVPEHWKAYYRGNQEELRLARKFSFSDRSRYYWPRPAVDAALQKMLSNLDQHRPPLSLLSQYLPAQAAELRAGTLAHDPRALIRSKIREVLAGYARACGMNAGPVPADFIEPERVN